MGLLDTVSGDTVEGLSHLFVTWACLSVRNGPECVSAGEFVIFNAVVNLRRCIYEHLRNFSLAITTLHLQEGDLPSHLRMAATQ